MLFSLNQKRNEAANIDVARDPHPHPQSAGSPDWVSRLRALHGDQQGPESSAVALLRELRDQEP
jgi:hypothetical protein